MRAFSLLHVTASADVLRTTDASVGEVVEPKSIQELPLNGRMLLDLVLTVPGTLAPNLTLTFDFRGP